MGRLTLNVLLSFAQFERELAGERIRDKIAASKKKGMWMGGLPPLGYDVRGRKTTQGSKFDRKSEDILTLTVEARLQRVGREMRMLVENRDHQTLADPGLLRIIARAHDINARLMQSTALTVHAVADQERITPGYISRLLRLPFLAPDIVIAIVNGKNPPQLTAKKLMRQALQIPVEWTEQRKLLGFHHR
jgi:Resolvase, N terminal domain